MKQLIKTEVILILIFFGMEWSQYQSYKNPPAVISVTTSNILDMAERRLKEGLEQQQQEQVKHHKGDITGYDMSSQDAVIF